MPAVNVLIKPASSACNLRCGYCFYCDVAAKREQGNYGFMSEATLENVIRRTLEYADGNCVIAYQGGEPTLRGLDFFQKSIEYQQKYNHKNVKIDNAIQTNGYRLDEAFVKFLGENKFLTGISLDGGRDTHNAYRRTHDGEETFFDVIATVDLFKKHGADYNILTVVNGKTGRRAGKMYAFFKRSGMDFLQFIPCLDPLGEQPGGNEYSLTPDVYGAFLCELFDLWHDDLQRGEQPYIRQFENYIGILLGYGAESCDMLGVCGRQYVVEADGEVYPCDFYVLPEYRLGNLNELSLREVEANRKQLGFIEYSANIRDNCKTCEYYHICRGGCRRHRLLPGENGVMLNYYCASYKKFFRHALPRMMAVANVLRNQRRGGMA